MAVKFRIKAVEYSDDDVRLYIQWPRFMSSYRKGRLLRKLINEDDRWMRLYYRYYWVDKKEVPTYKLRANESKYYHRKTTAAKMLEDSCALLDELYSEYERIYEFDKESDEKYKRKRKAEKNPTYLSREDCL
jgi:hypothetical protein